MHNCITVIQICSPSKGNLKPKFFAENLSTSFKDAVTQTNKSFIIVSGPALRIN